MTLKNIIRLFITIIILLFLFNLTTVFIVITLNQYFGLYYLCHFYIKESK